MLARDIPKRLRAKLEHDTRVNLHRHPIDIRVEGDDLILEGDVENVRAKKVALEIAAAMPEVAGVVDRLRIARRSTMTDAEIRDHLRDAFLQEAAFRELSIEVEAAGHRQGVRRVSGEGEGLIDAFVADGVVTLNGRVHSLAHKRLAGTLAWWIPGTRDVVNGLEVAPDEPDSDFEITEAVRLVLEKDRLVDASEIRVSTKDRVVTLKGFVPNEAIREMAELDAWYVLGVAGVANELEVSGR